MAKNRQKKLRVGVVGVGRGHTFMHHAASAGMDLVAVCDKWKEGLKRAAKSFKVPTFTNYYFAEAIRIGKQPFLDVYRSVAMSAVGFLAWRSMGYTDV